MILNFSPQKKELERLGRKRSEEQMLFHRKAGNGSDFGTIAELVCIGVAVPEDRQRIHAPDLNRRDKNA